MTGSDYKYAIMPEVSVIDEVINKGFMMTDIDSNVDFDVYVEDFSPVNFAAISFLESIGIDAPSEELITKTEKFLLQIGADVGGDNMHDSDSTV